MSSGRANDLFRRSRRFPPPPGHGQTPRPMVAWPAMEAAPEPSGRGARRRRDRPRGVVGHALLWAAVAGAGRGSTDAAGRRSGGRPPPRCVCWRSPRAFRAPRRPRGCSLLHDGRRARGGPESPYGGRSSPTELGRVEPRHRLCRVPGARGPAGWGAGPEGSASRRAAPGRRRGRRRWWALLAKAVPGARPRRATAWPGSGSRSATGTRSR